MPRACHALTRTRPRYIAMTRSGHVVEQDLKPEQRASKYRTIAGEIRELARSAQLEESRTSLFNLANAYERMAGAAESGTWESAHSSMPAHVSASAQPVSDRGPSQSAPITPIAETTRSRLRARH